MPFESLMSVIQVAESTLSKVLSKKGTRINDKIKATSSLQEAINATEAYLTQNNHIYQPNNEISRLWNQAFTDMIKIDKYLANRLRQKGRFWSNPRLWLNQDSSMELIPDLKELNEECEMILVELDNRR